MVLLIGIFYVVKMPMKRLEEIFSRLMHYVTSKFSGVVTIVINFNQGGVRDAKINQEKKVDFREC